MRLIVPILINCLLVLLVYLADKHTTARKIPYMAKQIVIGVLFGGVSAFAPMNANFGIIEPLPARVKGGKIAKNQALADRALSIIDEIKEQRK